MQRSARSSTARPVLGRRWIERAVYVVLVPIFLFVSLFLPPASMGSRLFNADMPLITASSGGSVVGPNGSFLRVPPGALEKRARVSIEAIVCGEQSDVRVGNPNFLSDASAAGQLLQSELDSADLEALDAMPPGLIIYSPLYRFNIRGEMPSESTVSVPVPYELAAVERADIYGWDGEVWEWLPSQVTLDGLALRSELVSLPDLLVVTQRQSASMRIGVDVSPLGAAPLTGDVPLAYITAAGLHIEGEGRIGGSLPDLAALGPVGPARFLLSVTNVIDGVVRSDLVDNMIINEAYVQAHIDEVVGRVVSGPWAGAEISYLGVDRGLAPEFDSFIGRLADSLHQSEKKLAVRMGPARRGEGGWDTGALDLRSVGSKADIVRIPALVQPTAYQVAGDMDALLAWATGEVERSKIDLVVSANSHDSVDGLVTDVTYTDALGILARRIQTDDSDGVVMPGDAVNVALPDAQQMPLALDDDAQVYWFAYPDAQGRTHTVWLENSSSVVRKLQYVNFYALGGASLENALEFKNDRDMQYAVRAFLDSQATGGVSDGVIPESKFAFVCTIEDEAGQTVDRQIVPLSDPHWTWTAPNNPGNYVIKASLSDDGGQTNLQPASALGLKVPTPTFTPIPSPTPVPTNTPVPTAKPKPKAAAARPKALGGYFGYGIQAAMVADGDHGRIFSHVNTMGFNWVKQQVEWFRYNGAPGQYDWGPLDRIVQAANASGVNVLFSVVKAPGWARPPGDTDEGPPADPNTYGVFLREMAARYKGKVKAYEIWNEQNLYYEWGGRGGKLNAANYVQLLKVAYNAIKSVDPGAVVISGALTPTGVSDGDIAIDDRVYLEQMYQAGLARYCDAVGAHPSGYNNPPDADWRTFSDPATPNYKGHPSFFFRGTMESYRNIMVKYGDGHKRIWPTEFGWATVEGLGVPPASGYGYAADNTEAEQAQFLARAYQMGKAWGWVGPMFLWNLNFAPVSGKHDEKAAFGIVRHNWSPRPSFAALRDMPK